MNSPEIGKLVSKLRYNLKDRRPLRNPLGPQGRHNKIRKTITALLKHERIELNYHRGDESRGYAERLISDAIRYGDTHKETMEMASYWILEKPIIHKLFKVLAPRYQNCTLSYTKMWKAPKTYPGYHTDKCVLELRNNIYPSLGPDNSYNHNLIHNVLLREAKKVFEQEKAEKLAASSKANLEEAVKRTNDSEIVEGMEQVKIQEKKLSENVESKIKTETEKEATDLKLAKTEKTESISNVEEAVDADKLAAEASVTSQKEEEHSEITKDDHDAKETNTKSTFKENEK